jgi:hypothetical protein
MDKISASNYTNLSENSKKISKGIAEIKVSASADPFLRDRLKPLGGLLPAFLEIKSPN